MNFAEAEWLRLPLVPVTVKVLVDLRCWVALIVSVEVPLPVTLVGESVAVSDPGSPDTLSVTVPEKPLTAVTVTV